MWVATHRSQRGDASYRAILWMVMVPVVVAMVAVLVSTARRSGVVVAVAYAPCCGPGRKLASRAGPMP